MNEQLNITAGSNNDRKGQTACDDSIYSAYVSTHHGHVGLMSNHPLLEIEFRANLMAFLPPPPARILEIGFGTGATLERLAALGYRQLEGWDISEQCVSQAQSRNLPAVLHHVDALKALPDEVPNQYDAIIAKDLLEHLPRDGALPFVRGIHHVLKPGGVFIARLPNMSNPFSVFLRYDDFTHQLGFTENSLRQIFTLGGFERDLIRLEKDILPGWSLLRAGLVSTFIREKITGPLVRRIFRFALLSQRKGSPRVDTLRIIVAAHKANIKERS